MIGCAHETFDNFRSLTSCIVGLGRGSISLISQISSSIQGKFSYCLTPFLSLINSVLHFGENTIVSVDGAISTPLVSRPPYTYYLVSLEAISVEGKKIEFSKGAFYTIFSLSFLFNQ